MKHSLAQDYEQPHGYLTAKTRRNPLSPAARRAMFAAKATFLDPKNWPEDILETEILGQEAILKSQIEHEGTITGETGTDLVENCYDIFGWEGGTSPFTPAQYAFFPRPYEPETEIPSVASEPKPEIPVAVLDTSKWPINRAPEPMFTEPDPWRNGQRTVWDIARERKKLEAAN